MVAIDRGGRYWIGRSARYRKISSVAVERIRGAQLLRERFEYPARYSPARRTEGTFGIVEGPETLVKLELLNAETAALLASRRLHPTQRFAKRADGTAVLNSGTPDLQSSQSVLNQFQPTSAEPKVRIVRTVRVCRSVRMHRGAGHVSNQWCWHAFGDGCGDASFPSPRRRNRMRTAAVRPARVPVSGPSFARDSVRLTHTPRGCVDDWPRHPRGAAICGFDTWPAPRCMRTVRHTRTVRTIRTFGSALVG